ncbi:MAG: molybdenum cofactor biosynthesis protein MoaE [Rhodospirillaceae bacterium]
MAVRVQQDDFDVGVELERLASGNSAIGAVVSFVGLVREFGGPLSTAPVKLSALELEHYPGMTERQLLAIEEEARRRWPLEATLVVHRFGRLLPGERIVLVATASSHREAAFAACNFLVDWLKTRAPFWKLEETATGRGWVAAKAGDELAAAAWIEK